MIKFQIFNIHLFDSIKLFFFSILDFCSLPLVNLAVLFQFFATLCKNLQRLSDFDSIKNMERKFLSCLFTLQLVFILTFYIILTILHAFSTRPA